MIENLERCSKAFIFNYCYASLSLLTRCSVNNRRFKRIGRSPRSLRNPNKDRNMRKLFVRAEIENANLTRRSNRQQVHNC